MERKKIYQLTELLCEANNEWHAWLNKNKKSAFGWNNSEFGKKTFFVPKNVEFQLIRLNPPSSEMLSHLFPISVLFNQVEIDFGNKKFKITGQKSFKMGEFPVYTGITLSVFGKPKNYDSEIGTQSNYHPIKITLLGDEFICGNPPSKWEEIDSL